MRVRHVSSAHVIRNTDTQPRLLCVDMCLVFVCHSVPGLGFVKSDSSCGMQPRTWRVVLPVFACQTTNTQCAMSLCVSRNRRVNEAGGLLASKLGPCVLAKLGRVT